MLFAAPVLLAGASQTPPKPVQYVYPDSTLEEIQQAIDAGGTVCFDRLTRVSRQPAEFHQIARANPDLPPSASDPTKGFNIGRNGRDVHIIGLLGPNGERPRIHGGTVAFRVGRFVNLGFLGVPVNFRIENLELVNPDLASPLQLYSRIGIWVNEIAAQSTINNCRITITGKDGDPGHAMNHSVGIWFYLLASQPEAPPSGARIDVTNNTVTALRAHEGIHVDSFWPVPAGFTPPRALISNNTVEVFTPGGFPNQSGTNGATMATAILLAGNLSNSIVSDNVISGDGRSPGAQPPVEAVGLLLGALSPYDALTNLNVVGNNSESFNGDLHLRVDSVVSASTIARNSFGPATIAGVRCAGHHNRFVNNQFFGTYPGWPPFAAGPGLVWFTGTSSSNAVESIKLNGLPNGMDLCTQIRDDPRANLIGGYSRCPQP